MPIRMPANRFLTVALAAVATTACTRTKSESSLKKHNTIIEMLSGADGMLRSENTRIGLYYNGEIQFCDANTTSAEFHVKHLDHHHFFNKLWGYACINKDATVTRLFDGQKGTVANMEIDLEKDADKSNVEDDIYRVFDKQDQDLNVRTALSSLSPYSGSFWLLRLKDYGARKAIYNINLTRQDGYAEGLESGLVYVKNFFNIPFTETWRVLRKTTRDAPEQGQSAEEAKREQAAQVPAGVNAEAASQPPVSLGDAREIVRVWNQPGLFGWHIIDFSRDKHVSLDRRVVLMLPFYQEMKKRREALLRDQANAAKAAAEKTPAGANSLPASPRSDSGLPSSGVSPQSGVSGQGTNSLSPAPAANQPAAGAGVQPTQPPVTSGTTGGDRPATGAGSGGL